MAGLGLLRHSLIALSLLSGVSSVWAAEEIETEPSITTSHTKDYINEEGDWCQVEATSCYIIALCQGYGMNEFQCSFLKSCLKMSVYNGRALYEPHLGGYYSGRPEPYPGFNQNETQECIDEAKDMF